MAWISNPNRFAMLLLIFVESRGILAFTFHSTPSLLKHTSNYVFQFHHGRHHQQKFTKLFESDSKIPKEYRAEIYRAEQNTPAAQGRNARTTGYGIAAFVLLLCGVSNVALTEMMKLEGKGSLQELGYGWAQNIPLLSTIWGGYIDIILAGVFGTLVELENRTREETAEKIWLELKRRKEEASKPKKKKKTSSSTSKGGRKSSKKQSKRLAALAEVIVEEDRMTQGVAVEQEDIKETTTPETISQAENEDSGFMGKLKKFYNDADQLASSQALLLNKKLEDEGVLDKITDESGLKVIGKEAAAENAKKKESSTDSS